MIFPYLLFLDVREAQTRCDVTVYANGERSQAPFLSQGLGSSVYLGRPKGLNCSYTTRLGFACPKHRQGQGLCGQPHQTVTQSPGITPVTSRATWESSHEKPKSRCNNRGCLSTAARLCLGNLPPACGATVSLAPNLGLARVAWVTGMACFKGGGGNSGGLLLKILTRLFGERGLPLKSLLIDLYLAPGQGACAGEGVRGGLGEGSP